MSTPEHERDRTAVRVAGEENGTMRMTTLRGGAARLAIAGLALLASAAPAFAQAQKLLPPENKEGIDGKTWTSGFVTIVLLALVAVAAFLKSKRGHED